MSSNGAVPQIFESMEWTGVFHGCRTLKYTSVFSPIGWTVRSPVRRHLWSSMFREVRSTIPASPDRPLSPLASHCAMMRRVLLKMWNDGFRTYQPLWTRFSHITVGRSYRWESCKITSIKVGNSQVGPNWQIFITAAHTCMLAEEDNGRSSVRYIVRRGEVCRIQPCILVFNFSKSSVQGRKDVSCSRRDCH